MVFTLGFVITILSQFIYRHLDGQYNLPNRFEEEIPRLLKLLKYPVQMSKSSFITGKLNFLSLSFSCHHHQHHHFLFFHSFFLYHHHYHNFHCYAGLCNFAILWLSLLLHFLPHCYLPPFTLLSIFYPLFFFSIFVYFSLPFVS